MKLFFSILILIFFLLTTPFYSQIFNEDTLNQNNVTSTLVSFPPNTPLSSALELIGRFTKSNENKALINNLSSDVMINEALINIQYEKALNLLSNKYEFQVFESDSFYKISNKIEKKKRIEIKDDIFTSKQIKVHALLFEANTNELKKRGVNWQAILSKHGMVIGSDISSFLVSEINPLIPDYTLNIQLEGDIGPFSGYTNALLSFLESEQLGEVEAQLSITVRDGNKGVMQVGSDISIKQKDFAGNVLDAFYPTGTIIEVTPSIFSEDTLNYALLDLNVERSFAIPGEISTEIKKTKTQSEIVLKDGEEVIIAGLLYNQFVKVRSGIPILKDLPWWVLGLRYLTGNDRYENLQKEVVLIIKTEILPSIKENL